MGVAMIAVPMPPVALRFVAAQVGQTQWDSSEAFWEGTLWLGAIVLAVIVAVVVAGYVKHRLDRASDRRTPEFTLAQLRDLHTNGELSAAEFETLKRQMIGAREDTG